MTKEQILNAFYLAALKLDTHFQRHLDEIEKDKQLTLEL